MNDSAPNHRLPLGLFLEQPAARFYGRVVEVLCTRHYNRRSEEACLRWIRRFLFHKGTHPRELAESNLNRFLTHLAVSENVAASTQNQALAAVLLLYEYVLDRRQWATCYGRHPCAGGRIRTAYATANQVAFWQALQLAGVRAPVVNHGQISTLVLPAKPPAGP